MKYKKMDFSFEEETFCLKSQLVKLARKLRKKPTFWDKLSPSLGQRWDHQSAYHLSIPVKAKSDNEPYFNADYFAKYRLASVLKACSNESRESKSDFYYKRCKL